MNMPAQNSPTEPVVSVVIASVNGLGCLTECLEALAGQGDGVPFEVLVVDRCGEDLRRAVRERFPDPPVRVIPADARATIPALRAVGIRQARGRMVAVIEDHCMAPPGWLATIARAHQAGRRIVGGPVANGAAGRVVDRAVFLCEYAGFMPPIPSGVVPETPGNNSAYDRRLLAELGPEIEAEVWESFLHARMRDRGEAFYNDADMVISHKKEFGYRYFLSQRYHYSRSFAGMRLAGSPGWRRLGYAAAATVVLPAVLLARMARTVARKRAWADYLPTVPIVLTFVASWAWGEAVGAVLGPGRSLEVVE